MKTIHDLRPTHTANTLEIRGLKVYYCGNPISAIQRTDNPRNGSEYFVTANRFPVGIICLSDEDYNAVNEVLDMIEFTEINGKYVCSFLPFVRDVDNDTDIQWQYMLAIKRAKKLTPAGRKYSGKKFGGGIAFDVTKNELINLSNQIKNLCK